MLRNGHRLCRMLHGGWATRSRFVSSAKSEPSFSHQLDTADENAVKHEADDGKVSTYDQTRSLKVVLRRPKPLTREPFVKNLFFGKFDTVNCLLLSQGVIHYFT